MTSPACFSWMSALGIPLHHRHKSRIDRFPDHVLRLDVSDTDRPRTDRYITVVVQYMDAASTKPLAAEADRRMRIVMFIVGFAPVGLLACSLLELVPLHVVGFPGVGIALATTVWFLTRRALRSIAFRGLVGGLVAVLVYDGTRLPFVVFGKWPDFIPKIGIWLLDDPQAHWAVGYAWRYLGNGAGMGLAFAAIAPTLVPLGGRRRLGVIYGVAIWTGLMLTLVLAPEGQSKMFELTPATLALSLTGHLVYGAVLGYIVMDRQRRGTTRGNARKGRAVQWSMTRAIVDGTVVAESDATVVVEGNHYFPPDSVEWDHFTETEQTTVCGWKGTASYYTLSVGPNKLDNVAWTYREPMDAASEIKDFVAFYPSVTVEG